MCKIGESRKKREVQLLTIKTRQKYTKGSHDGVDRRTNNPEEKRGREITELTSHKELNEKMRLVGDPEYQWQRQDLMSEELNGPTC